MTNYIVETYIPFSFEIEAESKEEAIKLAKEQTLDEVRDNPTYIEYVEFKSVEEFKDN